MTEHFQFAQPEWLYVLPFILCLIILRRRRGAEGSITYPTVRFISSLARNPQSLAGKIGAICFVLAAAALAIALARPQKVEDKTFRTVNGIDIMIAFDLSYSMETPDMVLNRMPINRLVAAKHVITQFVDSRPDDRIGIVAFAAMPYTIAPLTTDHAWLLLQMDRIQTGMLEDATAIGDAIASGVNRLRDSKAKSKIVILLTDGIHNAGRLTPPDAAQAAAALGIKVYTIGAGSDQPRATGIFGFMQPGTEIDEATLKKIAEITKAKYFRATDLKSLEETYQAIDQMEKTKIELDQYTRYEEKFAPFLVLGFLCLALEVLLGFTRLGRLP